MKLPKEIKIGAHKIKILCPYTFDDDGNKQGRSEWSQGLIKISPFNASGKELSPTALFQVFLHELIHMFDAVCSTRLFDSSEETEGKVDMLAEIILGVLIDNGYLKLEDFDGHPE